MRGPAGDVTERTVDHILTSANTSKSQGATVVLGAARELDATDVETCLGTSVVSSSRGDVLGRFWILFPGT